MYKFYVICMKTKNNYKLYLSCSFGKSMKWDNKEEACWFENYEEAERFAKQYFKNFNKWFIEEIECKECV